MTMNKANSTRLHGLAEIFTVSLRLGLTSFGGPIAHLGYFYNEYVERRKWLDEKSYADLVALCQVLPGPASSQVGMGIGAMRGGVMGAVAAWLGFTLPSFLILVFFALFLESLQLNNTGFIYGLKIVAVAIVAHAVLGMGRKLTPDRDRATIAIVTAIIILLWHTAFTQVFLIFAAAVTGVFLYKDKVIPNVSSINLSISRRFAMVCIALFFSLLVVLPILRQVFSFQAMALLDSFYRAGALVFGGGHVVLPLLEREVVPVGWVSQELFLAGYGAAQAVPGPLFTFGSYLGAVTAGWSGAIIATLAVFFPAALLILGILPFWNSLRKYPKVQGALTGVNAAVVGLLLAALYDPIWTSSINRPLDFAFAAVLFGMLEYWKLQPLIIVLTGAIGGSILFML
ncbi:chromate transporter [Desulfitibacter alkalitolerans]|uniref:chromate transporter n=1 Tax=Desulfitibacter alkalitolerans TaxID=264641 RepID=UPI000554C501